MFKGLKFKREFFLPINRMHPRAVLLAFRDTFVYIQLALHGRMLIYDRLGNRSALDWVIDQYQVSTDKRSGITSDPNRDDDEAYIVNLVGRVITVSVETVRIVKGLPEQFSE